MSRLHHNSFDLASWQGHRACRWLINANVPLPHHRHGLSTLQLHLWVADRETRYLSAASGLFRPRGLDHPCREACRVRLCQHKIWTACPHMLSSSKLRNPERENLLPGFQKLSNPVSRMVQFGTWLRCSIDKSEGDLSNGQAALRCALAIEYLILLAVQC